jgi:hypothetical protein
MLTRLGLFCETLRVALAALRRAHPRLYTRVPEEVRSRYLKDDGTETRYRDAKSEHARRRVDVCARDVYRVLAVCAGKSAAKLEEIKLLQRLFDDQCEVVADERKPGADDDDAGQGGAPVVVKEPKTISSDSLQTPHDPDVTYSGHKGKGYELQIAETCNEENDVEILTHVELTPSCGSDVDAAIPALEDLEKRTLRPDELVADTTYGSAKNAVEAAKLGTELVSPLGGTDARYWRLQSRRATPESCIVPRWSRGDFAAIRVQAVQHGRAPVRRCQVRRMPHGRALPLEDQVW